MAKYNVVRYRSDNKPGMRLNWVNLFTWCLGIIWGWALLALIGSEQLTRDAWWGVGFAVLTLVALGTIYQLAQANREGDDSGSTVVLAAFVALLLGVVYNVFSRALGNEVADQADKGLLVSLAFFLIAGSNALTTWWPHGRPTINRNERRQPVVQPVAGSSETLPDVSQESAA